MTINNFLDICSKFLDKNILLVLKKTITPAEVFKAYKNFKYEVWQVQGSLKELIVEAEINVRAVSDSDYKNAELSCEKEVCEKMIKYIRKYEVTKV